MNGPPSIGQHWICGSSVGSDLMSQDRPGPHSPRQQPPERPRHAAISPRVLTQRARINLELDQPAHRLERVAKQILRPLERSEQVAQERERRPFGPSEKKSRPARLINPALDRCDLQVRVDLLVDDDEPFRSFQVADAFRQRTIAHRGKPSDFRMAERTRTKETVARKPSC